MLGEDPLRALDWKSRIGKDREQVGCSVSGMGGPCPWPMSPYQAMGGVSYLPLGTPKGSLQRPILVGRLGQPLGASGYPDPALEAVVEHGVWWPSCGPIKAQVLSSIVGSAEGLEGTSLLQERRMMRMMK